MAAGAGATALSWFVAQHSLLGARWHFIGFIAAWVALWLVGAAAAVRVGSTRLAVVTVVVFAAAMRLAAASGTTPSISSDLYRYGWDAHVQLSGIDPYRYPPDSRHVEQLREPPWYPGPAGCARLGMKTGCTVIGRAQVRTIYPPVAEAWFDIVYVAWPGHEGARPWQMAGGLVDDAVIVVLAVALARSGRDPRQVAWYALSPVAVVEFAGNGHVDSLALLLLIAAVMALRRERRLLAGVLIGMATMVKLYPAVAVVAAWRKGKWKMTIGFVATVVASELPHLLFVGRRLLGYLPGYLREEHYESGARYLILGLLPLSSRAVTALAALSVLAAVVLVVRSRWDPTLGIAVLLGTVIMVASPVQPWYAVTLAGVGILADVPWLILAALAAEPYYATVILADPHQVGAGRACYGAALIGIVTALCLRHRSRPASMAVPPGWPRWP